ncbi:FAD-dependent monooxygenase [Agrobacterium vitis]|uniref:FAD-dependent monooxygenase n=1 Tax=Agrobacterium vitis TaxID=373 RepID=UPI0015743F16|nr:FAD-dependent monooxygenase [Agrobacterium vitis]NSZ16982.1 salicylate hydroxylase [Agrobacterium vitis]QZO02733.1 FAD-dependent monooxygenase [Agrobacterium vitis]UJL87858.1 FAD-dependent monooxygenase [Agrobacterium vitis]
MSTKTVAIVGGGIAGLVASLCFARQGIASRIFEKSPQLLEVGAGLQLTPNVTWILDELGVLENLRTRWHEPDVVALASGISLKRLCNVPVGAHAKSRWQAPYGVLHRATLQQALLEAVAQNPLCSLTLDQRVESPDAQILRDPQTGERPDLLIAADGVWSRLRNFVAGGPDVSFSGSIAWRVALPQAEAPAFLDRQSVTAFLGPNAHMVTYPLRDTDSINIVAIGAGVDPGEGWAAQTQESQALLLERAFKGWNSDIRTMLANAKGNMTFWPLFQAGNGRWHNDKDLVLIGDAAHAMLPFSAQGAAMAIEDAFELADLVSSRSIPQALAAYEASRQKRVSAVRKRGAINKFAYHAKGPLQIGRDVLLSLRSSDSFARDLDWLYGYRPFFQVQ